MPRRPLLSAVLGAALAATLVPLTAAPASASSVTPPGGCAIPVDATMTDALSRVASHPRVVLGATDHKAIAARATDTVSHRQQMRWADDSLTQPLPSSSGDRAATARNSLRRMLWLTYGSIKATDSSKKAAYRKRIVDEAVTIASWPDWTPTHLFTTSEIATTVAYGYSASASDMTVTQRSTVRNALIRKALAPASCLWAAGRWEVTSTDNWGIVTNSAMAMAALVVTDQDRTLAGAALGRAMTYGPRAIQTIAVDGGSREGVLYAALGGRYTAYVTGSLRAGLGQTFASRIPKVGPASAFRVATTGPSGEAFDFADSDGQVEPPYLPAYNGAYYGDGLGQWLTDQWVKASHADPLLAIWQRGSGTPPEQALPDTVRFKRTLVAAIRQNWTPTGTWLAVKGGDNKSPHSHLDLGTFALEIGGKRFIDDPGRDSYALPGYFDLSKRFGYWRPSTASHSTLSVPGKNQPPSASAGMSAPSLLSAGVDMRRALGIPGATRTVWLDSSDRAVVRDELTTNAAATFRWKAWTQASVSLSSNGRKAYLTRDGVTIVAALTSDTPGAFRLETAPSAPSGGYSTSGWKALVLDVSTKASPSGGYTARATVWFGKT